MNSIRKSIRPLLRLSDPRLLLGVVALLGAMPASAAEFTYQYFRFKPTKINNNGVNIQLAEFTFSRAGARLNLNNGNGTGVNPVPVTASSAGQTTGNELPPLVVDGNIATKWYRGAATTNGNELIFNFNVPVTVDSYSFATAGDSTLYARTPVSWQMAGSTNGTDWILLDARADAITTIANNTYQAEFILPATVPPIVNSFEVLGPAAPNSSAIVLNGNTVNLGWATSNATEVKLISPAFPAGEMVAVTGTKTVTPPANSTTAYQLTATKAGSPDAVATATARAVVGGSKTYRYVRYSILQRRGGFGSTNMVQVSEFEFYNGDATVAANKVAITGATNDGGNNLNVDQAPTKLFDGILTSKWLDNNNKPVVFDFGTPKTFDRYLFVTGGDAVDRDPVQWKLEGSNDQSRWDVIENVDFNYPTPLARNASSLSIPLPGAGLPLLLEYFAGDSPTVVAGQPLILSYSTQHAVSVELISSNGDETLPPTPALYGSVQVFPTVDTTYALLATGEDGTTATLSFFVTIGVDSGVNDIAFTNFDGAAPALTYGGAVKPTITAADSVYPNRLRLTQEAQGLSGTAWFAKKLDGRNGFEATFGLSMNVTNPSTAIPADGTAFVIQNSPLGSGDPGTGENGVSQNALNICFHTFGFEAATASKIEVRSGTSSLASVTAFNYPGLVVHGVPGLTNGVIDRAAGTPYTLASLASDPPYNIRVVYVPGDLDVYVDGIAVIQNVNVNLSTIGATDANGKSFFGFTARTGGNVQANDITNWTVKFGNFATQLPFSTVKNLFRYTAGNPVPTRLDMVWNARAGRDYLIYKSLDLVDWEIAGGAAGVNGQAGAVIDLPVAVGTAQKAFFRVQELPPN